MHQGLGRGKHHLPGGFQKLTAIGLERYHADLLRAEKTCYIPNGESEVIAGAAIKTLPAKDFSAAGVEAAVRAIQAGTIGYEDFCERIAAGCVGHFVSLPGRRVVYCGGTGESHVEHFPGTE